MGLNPNTCWSQATPSSTTLARSTRDVMERDGGPRCEMCEVGWLGTLPSTLFLFLIRRFCQVLAVIYGFRSRIPNATALSKKAVMAEQRSGVEERGEVCGDEHNNLHWSCHCLAMHFKLLNTSYYNLKSSWLEMTSRVNVVDRVQSACERNTIMTSQHALLRVKTLLPIL